MTKCPIKIMVASVHQRLTTIAKDENRPFQDLLQLYASERWRFRLSQSPHRDRFVLKGALLLVAWNLFLGLLMPSCLVAQQKPSDEFRIFDGQPTRLFMTGNSHHPTYGLDKLAKLLDRYFDGKSPIVVAGLADARKDPITQKPIPTAKLTELIRFLEPEFIARAKQPGPRERLIILNYVIVNAPRKEADGAWVKTDADALQAYAQMAIERGVQRVFFSEMVQPNHITGGNFGNKFRREGLRVFDELVRRKLPGIERGPTLQVQMEQQRHFFRDDRHFSDAGRDFIACLWLETLLKHDGRPVPAWLKDEMQTLLSDANAVSEDMTREIESAVRRGLALLDQAGPNWRKHKSCFSCHHQTLPMLAKIEASRVGFPTDAAWLKSQADFSHKYFTEHIEIMNEAKHLPGGSFTASYGLWALSLDQRPADETTTAMVTYLLKIQGVVRLEDREPSTTATNREGRWMTSCDRPPLQSSQIAATVLALTGMNQYATAEQRPLLAAARERADKWLTQAPLKTQEDRVWRLWGLQRLDGAAAARQIEATRAIILAAQREDGGWPQTEDFRSDAYSTGQTLFVLRQTGSAPSDPAVQRATKFLLTTQHEDGSWLVETRVKPAQTYFDNGDPHGKHQFLSTAATAWATAGLTQLLPRK